MDSGRRDFTLGLYEASKIFALDEGLPKTNKRAWKGHGKFFVALAVVQAEAEKEMYRGIGRCALCNHTQTLGLYKYREWVWPANFQHYLIYHFAEPSDEFAKFIAESYSIIQKLKKR